jgi:hypothetical protein
MTVTELLESVRRVKVRTNRLVNDTLGGAASRRRFQDFAGICGRTV